MRIKCKNYIIFRVRVYADKKLLDKWSPDEPLPEQHHERASSWNKFFWHLFSIEEGINEMDFWKTYQFMHMDCAIDVLQENKGILIQKGEGDNTLLIPAGNYKLVKDVKKMLKDNKLPFRIMKKVNLGYLGYRCVSRDLKENRRRSLEFTEDFRIVKQ